MPEGFENAADGLLVFDRNGQLEVTYLTIKGWWKLTCCEGHGEIGEESDAHQFEVVGETDGIDDGSWAKVDKCASREVTVHEVEVDVAFAACYHAQTMVVDDEGRLLLHDESEYKRLAVNHRQFVAEENALTDLREVVLKDVTHSRHV